MPLPGFLRLRALLDRVADQVAPFRPRAVIVLDVLVAEDVLQHKPRMRRPLPDAAVGYDFVLTAGDALAAVERLQGFLALERAVFGHCLRPGNVDGRRDVTGALGGFAHAGRRD